MPNRRGALPSILYQVATINERKPERILAFEGDETANDESREVASDLNTRITVGVHVNPIHLEK